MKAYLFLSAMSAKIRCIFDSSLGLYWFRFHMDHTPSIVRCHYYCRMNMWCLYIVAVGSAKFISTNADNKIYLFTNCRSLLNGEVKTTIVSFAMLWRHWWCIYHNICWHYDMLPTWGCLTRGPPLAMRHRRSDIWIFVQYRIKLT